MPPQCLPLALALALTFRKITTSSWVVGGGGGGGGGGVGSVSGVPFDVCIGKGVEGWVGEEGEGLGGGAGKRDQNKGRGKDQRESSGTSVRG